MRQGLVVLLLIPPHLILSYTDPEIKKEITTNIKEYPILEELSDLQPVCKDLSLRANSFYS